MPRAKRPKPTERPQPGAGAPDGESLADLLQRGKRQGYVTYDDLLDLLPEAEENLDGLEELYEILEDAGVSVNLNGGSAALPIKRTAKSDYVGIDSDDTVSLYLREVSRVPLLTAEQEVDLSQRIERGYAARKKLDDDGESLTDGLTADLRLVAADGAAAREHLVRANARLVIAMAKRYMHQGVPFLDLIQEGNMGLMKAADKFDWRRGHKFSTYATWWVRQAISRALADQGRTIRVPVHMSDRIRRLYHTSRRLEQELGREPTLEELAGELEMSVKQVETTLEISQRPLSLEKPVGEDHDSELGEFIEDEDAGVPDRDAETAMLRDDLEDVLMGLTQREARVLELRYGLNDGHAYTLKEVGEKFGLTRERIRQIENEALARLREPRRAGRLLDYMS